MIAKFPLRHTWISQGMNYAYSHKDTKAIDWGSLAAYKDYNLYAPFDGKIVWSDAVSKGGSIALQSDEPVLYADGTYDYMTVITAHDNDRPSAGKHFSQGDLYSHMGTAGGVAKHCHMEIQRGKFVKPTSTIKQPCGMNVYKYVNTIEPNKALYLTKDTIMDDAKSEFHYQWKVEEDIMPVPRDETRNQINVTVDKLRIRTSPNLSAAIKGFAEKGYYNIFDVAYDTDYTWYEIDTDSWVAGVGGVEYLEAKENGKLITLTKDDGYEYRFTLDANKYGTSGQVATMKNHYDDKLINDGWEEVIATNGGIFYQWDKNWYANGIEKSRGINNQELDMTCVSDYNDSIAMGFDYNGNIVFDTQKNIISKFDSYYGAVSGCFGIMLNGSECKVGRDLFKDQFNCISGRTIWGKDKEGNVMVYSLEGVTGKSGLYGKELYEKCKALGFYTAFCFDGGGSVWMRYNGEDIHSTTRSVKNSIHLYRKKKEEIDYKKLYEELKADYDKVVDRCRAYEEKLVECEDIISKKQKVIDAIKEIIQ